MLLRGWHDIGTGSTGIVVLPATLNVITDGPVVVPLGSVFGHRVGITIQGLHAAALIVTRVVLSISLVVPLTLTTAWSRLLAALRSLSVPRIFIVILATAYRYIFQLLDVTDEMYVARKARTVKADRDCASERRFVATTAGSLSWWLMKCLASNTSRARTLVGSQTLTMFPNHQPGRNSGVRWC